MANRYISEKALIDNIVKIEDLRTLSTKTIGEAISKTPTADVVEVVRCKDCKYAKAVIHRGQEMPNIFKCTYLKPNTTLFDIDFCRYGKRSDT